MFCAPCLTDVPDDDWYSHLVIEHIDKRLDKMEKRIMTAFADVQGVVDTLAASAGEIASGLGTIESQVATALSGTVDLSVLQTNLATAQAALAAVQAVIPAPAPEPVTPPAE